MASKKTVAIIFGGQSAEHDVSLKSAEALYNNLDKKKFIPRFIYISRQDGKWRSFDEKTFTGKTFEDSPGFSFLPWSNRDCDMLDADIYFPMLHGPNGEDGKIQALLEMAGKPYVGADSMSSALAMDKITSKILFAKAGLNIVPYLFFRTKNLKRIGQDVARHLGYPVFVKPCSMGSSVGISKAYDPVGLEQAVELAFRYDRKVLIEKAMDIREIEVSVMGNEHVMISRPGELIPHNDFYDYNDKYIDGKTTFHMPAQLSLEHEQNVRKVAGEAYKALFLNGMSRVDLFIEKQSGLIYVNEINTIPGFTEISMFPKLWTLQDISFTGLITRLIDYGFDFHLRQKASTDR